MLLIICVFTMLILKKHKLFLCFLTNKLKIYKLFLLEKFKQIFLI